MKVEFCNNLSKEQIIFATCASNRVTIYECQNQGIKLLQSYEDPNPKEAYYTCSWSYETHALHPVLAVGGVLRIIRIIDTATMTSPKYFIGHGQAINELKFHPTNPIILLSASKDYTVRLWNIQTEVCIAIFGGVEGHAAVVLSADFDITGNRIASCATDRSIKVWHIDKPSIQEAIKASHTFSRGISERNFNTIVEHFPDFSTQNIHESYVDCIKWMGNLLLSKVLPLPSNYSKNHFFKYNFSVMRKCYSVLEAQGHEQRNGKI